MIEYKIYKDKYKKMWDDFVGRTKDSTIFHSQLFLEYHIDRKFPNHSLMFYKNGKLKREGRLKNGKNDGLWKGYYENGELMEEGNFKIGKKVGSWKYYNQDGQLKTKYYSLK